MSTTAATAAASAAAAAASTTSPGTAPTQYRYVALDLDGTLLNNNHKLSENTKTYLRELDAKGFGIMIATGRAINTVYEHIIDLNLPRPLPVICSNGGRGLFCQPDPTNTATGVASTVLFAIPVPRPVAQRTISYAKELGCLTQFYIGDDIYADPSTPEQKQLVQYYKDLTGSKTKLVDDMQKVLESTGLPSKQLVLFPTSDQDRVMEAFAKELSQPDLLVEGKPAHLIRGSLGWFMEVLHPDVCKGEGLKLMCRDHLKVALEDVIAFGDGDNDLEFLQYAGRGIVMKNGRDVVKAVADEVIDLTNDQDGVVETLKRMEQNGQLIFSRDDK